MKRLDTYRIKRELIEIIGEIAVRVEDSAAEAMKRAEAAEDGGLARFALKMMNRNIEIARETSSPVCQDTGMCVVFIDIGQEVTLCGEYLGDAVDGGVREAYALLRKSVLDPVTRVNTGDNTPAVLHTRIVPGDKVTMSVMLKGFGSENMSRIRLFNPAEGIEAAKDFIVDTVREAGSNPCPPVIVGVGLGGTFEKCAEISKRALFRKIGSVNADAGLAAMESELTERINALGIGAQGFRGKTSCLGVFIEKYPTHISSLPVAVNILCHCSRCKTAVLEGE